MAEKRRRERLDKLLVARGLAASRERAQGLIMAGEVQVNQQRVDKPGTQVAHTDTVVILGNDQPYASRGGLKLVAALESWQIDVTGKSVVDIGASTGGFTDCVLQRGAARVRAIDVGYGQFAWHLRQDPRVELLERTNVRSFDPATVAAEFDLAVVDVSFISLRLVLASVAAMVRPGGRLLPLVKPQFEVGRELIGKGGVVRDPLVRLEAVAAVRDFATSLGLVCRGALLCPVAGPKGNREFFLDIERPLEVADIEHPQGETDA